MRMNPLLLGKRSKFRILLGDYALVRDESHIIAALVEIGKAAVLISGGQLEGFNA